TLRDTQSGNRYVGRRVNAPAKLLGGLNRVSPHGQTRAKDASDNLLEHRRIPVVAEAWQQKSGVGTRVPKRRRDVACRRGPRRLEPELAKVCRLTSGDIARTTVRITKDRNRTRRLFSQSQPRAFEFPSRGSVIEPRHDRVRNRMGPE